MTDGRDESLFGSDALILQGLTGLEEEIAEMANEEAARIPEENSSAQSQPAPAAAESPKDKSENWNRVSPRPMAPPPGGDAAEEEKSTAKPGPAAEPAPASPAEPAPASPAAEIFQRAPEASNEPAKPGGDVQHLSAREMQKARQQTAAQKRSAIRRREIEDLMGSEDSNGENPLFLKPNETPTSRVVAAPNQPPLEPLPPRAKTSEPPVEAPLRPQEPRPMKPPSTPMAPPDPEPVAQPSIDGSKEVAAPKPVEPAPKSTPVSPPQGDATNPFTAVAPASSASSMPAETQPVGDRPPVSIEPPRARTEAVSADLLSPSDGSEFETAVPKRIVEPEPDRMIEKNLLSSTKPAEPLEARKADEVAEMSGIEDEEELSLGGDPEPAEPKSRRPKTQSHRVRSGRDSGSLRHTDEEEFQDEPRAHRSARSGSFWPALLSATFLNLLLLGLAGLLLWPMVRNKLSEVQNNQQGDSSRYLKAQNLFTQAALSGEKGPFKEMKNEALVDAKLGAFVDEKEQWLRDYFEKKISEHSFSPSIFNDLDVKEESELMGSDFWQIFSRTKIDAEGRKSLDKFVYGPLDRARAAFLLGGLGARADVNKEFVNLLEDEDDLVVLVGGINAYSGITQETIRGIDLARIQEYVQQQSETAPEN